MTEENIFLDKKQLSSIIIAKESALVSCYAEIIKDINSGYTTEDKINTPEYRYEDYEICWNLIHEIYTFIRFNKVKELEKKNKDDEFGKELKEIKEIIRLYENPENKIVETETIEDIPERKFVKFKDLKIIVPIIQKIISECGYHDDTFQSTGVDETPQFIPEFKGKKK